MPGLGDSKASPKRVTGTGAARYICGNKHVMDKPKRSPRPHRVVVAMSCPLSLADQLSELARSTGRSAADILRTALTEYLDGYAK